MSLTRAPPSSAAFSCASRSAMSMCLYLTCNRHTYSLQAKGAQVVARSRNFAAVQLATLLTKGGDHLPNLTYCSARGSLGAFLHPSSTHPEAPYLNLLALQRRMPSMIDAWLSSSLMTASSGPSRASNSPALASKQLGYRIVSSVPWKALMRPSSCL